MNALPRSRIIIRDPARAKNGDLMRHAVLLAGLLALLIAPPSVCAQDPPPIRQLGPVLYTATETFGAVSQVRALANGRVIVHDNSGRRVLLLDSALKKLVVIADTTGATSSAYGSRLGGLIAYRGDSTLFVDPVTYAMLVIDSNGKVVRTMAAPQPDQVQNLIGGPFGTPGFDALGRLVFRAQMRPVPTGPNQGGAFRVPQQPDSSLIVRFDFSNRKLDSLTKYKIPFVALSMTKNQYGAVTVMQTVNPMPQTDDWALLADGTIAVVRGKEYRVDFFSPDGSVRSGPRLPFEWSRLRDEDKVAVIDSTRTAMEKLRAAYIAKLAAANPIPAPAATTTSTGRQLAVTDEVTSVNIYRSDGNPLGPAAPPLEYVAPSELPDYRPAFRQGAARGDADGNLWVRTTRIVDGGAVYDVIDIKGVLVDRVQVPPGRFIAGFGPRGATYMGVVDGEITRLERAQYRRPVRF